MQQPLGRQGAWPAACTVRSAGPGFSSVPGGWRKHASALSECVSALHCFFLPVLRTGIAVRSFVLFLAVGVQDRVLAQCRFGAEGLPHLCGWHRPSSHLQGPVPALPTAGTRTLPLPVVSCCCHLEKQRVMTGPPVSGLALRETLGTRCAGLCWAVLGCALADGQAMVYPAVYLSLSLLTSDMQSSKQSWDERGGNSGILIATNQNKLLEFRFQELGQYALFSFNFMSKRAK